MDRPRLPATYPQIRAIYAVGRALGYDDEAVEIECHKQYGMTVDGLSRRQASEFIDWLKDNPR